MPQTYFELLAPINYQDKWYTDLKEAFREVKVMATIYLLTLLNPIRNSIGWDFLYNTLKFFTFFLHISEKSCMFEDE